MAAPGATPIILYHTTTAAAQPSTSNLNVGELAINVTDKKVYSKDGGGALITVVGTLGNQEASAVAITGGTINAVVIGGSTAAAATVTTLTATADSSFTSTGAVKIPVGTAGQQPGTPAQGMIRFNTDTPGFEGYNGSAWGALGGGNTTAKGMWENSNTISTNYTITTNYNAMSAGTITVDSGVTVTVPAGSRWVIVQEKQMASIINAISSGAGGVAVTGDSSGILNIQTAGTTAITVDASQNVGIGTASPASKLSVNNADDVTNLITSGATNLIRYIGYRTVTAASVIEATNSAQNAYAPLFINASILQLGTGGAEQMRIAADGTITSALGGMQVRSGTAVTSTSGTAIDFTSIPSWAKRITVMFSGVSTNGSSLYLIQIGDSGGIENTSYVSGAFDNSTSNNSTAGFVITSQNINTANWSGSVTVCNLSGNVWTSSGSISTTVGGYIASSGGAKELSATLDRIRITTVNGTDTFDAGTINILYEQDLL